ncbi:hypothetical protein KGM_208242B, partial [Danaus plexippus plexippus]
DAVVFTVSRCGKPQLRYGQYRFSERPKTGPKTNWRCIRQAKGCRARIVTVDDNLVKIHNHHNH